MRTPPIVSPMAAPAKGHHTAIKSPFSSHQFVPELAIIRRRVVPLEAIVKGDLLNMKGFEDFRTKMAQTKAIIWNAHAPDGLSNGRAPRLARECVRESV